MLKWKNLLDIRVIDTVTGKLMINVYKAVNYIKA